MNVLLLGANGQLGSDLVAAGEATDGLTLTPLKRAHVDVTDRDGLRDTLADMPFDAVINCTSYHRTDDAEHQAQLAFDVNAHAVAVLAEVCAARGARLVHISTDYVFDGQAKTPYREDDPIGPVNVYGASKAMGERLASALSDDILVFRVASLFGVAGASGKGGNFVETMIRLGRERGELRVVADQFMSPTATADIAPRILAALAGGLPAGTYHLVSSGEASWHQFAERIIHSVGASAKVHAIPTEEYPTEARRPPYSVLENDKVSVRLGQMPHWEDALGRYLKDKGHVT